MCVEHVTAPLRVRGPLQWVEVPKDQPRIEQPRTRQQHATEFLRRLKKLRAGLSRGCLQTVEYCLQRWHDIGVLVDALPDAGFTAKDVGDA